MRSSVNRPRILTHPGTGERRPFSIIRDEIHVPELSRPPYDAGEWGEYVFGAWLEEDADHPGVFYISFPYWRNGRFAGQYTLRAEPWVVRSLVNEMQSRGWFERRGWLDLDGPSGPRQAAQAPPPDDSKDGDA